MEVLAAWRAELLVLRKWKVAWVLVAIAPATVLLQAYGFTFAIYLGSRTDSAFGSPTQLLAPMLSSQFILSALEQFGQTAPFILLGAVIADGDWGRGTGRYRRLRRHPAVDHGRAAAAGSVRHRDAAPGPAGLRPSSRAASNTLSYLYGQVSTYGNTAVFGRLAPWLAIAALAAYVVVGVTLAVGLTRRRDIA